MARLLGVGAWKDLGKRALSVKEFKIKDMFLVNLCVACLESKPIMRPTFPQIVK